MTEKELELKLLDNPNYSSQWIKNAAILLSETDLTEEELSAYNAEQLEVIVAVFNMSVQNEQIWIGGFLNPQLNATQMQLLLNGYSNGLTTQQLLMYFNPSIPYIKSNWGISALVDGFNIDSYIEDGFDKDQLREIYSGLKDGISIENMLYTDINIPAEKMALARHALVLRMGIEFGDDYELTIY